MMAIWRFRFVLCAALAVVALLAIACSGDDDANDAGDATGEATPTATAGATGEGDDDAGQSLACELLGLADVESVAGDVISIQEGFPGEFMNCYAFVSGGEVVLEVCECLTDEEFDQKVVDAARGRGTVSETVLAVGDRAEWVLAGEHDPTTGFLWVKSGERTLNLWVDVRTYDDIADARADAVAMMNEILAGMP